MYLDCKIFGQNDVRCYLQQKKKIAKGVAYTILSQNYFIGYFQEELMKFCC